MHFDPKLKIHLACDTSAYDGGAVHLHRMPDGSEKPVGFASRTPTETEKKYSQMEKEAHVYGAKHFHAYICWVINLCFQMDHKLLRTLLSESKVTSLQQDSEVAERLKGGLEHPVGP